MPFMSKLTPSVLGLVFCLFACVTTHSGKESVSSDNQHSLSCARQQEYDAGNVFALLCTYENKADTWQNFHVAKVTFEKEPDATVLTPQQVAAYVDAVNTRNKMQNHNTNLALGSLFVLGVVAAGTNGHDAATAGIITAGTSGALMAGRELSAEQSEATRGGIAFGSTHLLGPETQVPGKLFIRRTLLIETSKNIPSSLNICVDKPQQECHTIKIDLGSAANRKRTTY